MFGSVTLEFQIRSKIQQIMPFNDMQLLSNRMQELPGLLCESFGWFGYLTNMRRISLQGS